VTDDHQVHCYVDHSEFTIADPYQQLQGRNDLKTVYTKYHHEIVLFNHLEIKLNQFRNHSKQHQRQLQTALNVGTNH
jgi:hypothetical protein